MNPREQDDAPLFEPPRKDFPRCPYPECNHGWHGLPCPVVTCGCVTSCSRPPIVPKPTTQEDS